MIINYNKKLVFTKIVYYGPAMCGKTTSLKSLFNLFNKGSEIRSIETTTGRTLFFDFGTLDFKGLEWNIKIYLYSTTGQDFYQSTRPATLHGVDGIIFIVDSQKQLLEFNIASWNELKNFFKQKLAQIPVVISLNKFDLKNTINEDVIKKKFKLDDYRPIEIIPTIATNGFGIKSTFSSIMGQIFPNFKLNL